MLCPYCGAEMAKGYIHGGRQDTPIWSPKPAKLLALLPGKDELWVGDPGTRKLPPAYYCKSCRKMIVCCEEE